MFTITQPHLTIAARSLGLELKALLRWQMIIAKLFGAHAMSGFARVVVGKEQAGFTGTFCKMLVAQIQGRKIILPQ